MLQVTLTILTMSEGQLTLSVGVIIWSTLTLGCPDWKPHSPLFSCVTLGKLLDLSDQVKSDLT